MSKLRSVNTHFWSDNYIIELSPQMKLLFLYLLTNDHTNMLGIYELHIRKISFDTGIDEEPIRKGFEAFHKDGKASYIQGYVCLHNFTRHQSYNDNMKKAAINSFNELPLEVRKQPFCIPLVKGLKPFPEGFEPIAEIEYEKEREIEREYEIEEEGERESARVKGCPIPEELQIEGFKERYLAYWDYILETKKQQASIPAVESHFRKLIELKQDGNDPLAVIDQTIAAGNKSFYPLKDQQFNNDESTRKTKGDRRADILREDLTGEWVE